MAAGLSSGSRLRIGSMMSRIEGDQHAAATTHHGDRQHVLDRIEEENAVEIAGSEVVDDTSPLEHRLDVVEGEAVALEHDPAGGLGCRASGSNEDAAAPQVGDRPDVAGRWAAMWTTVGNRHGHRAQPGVRAWVVGRALPVGEVGRPCPFEGQVDLAALERLGARLRVEAVPRLTWMPGNSSYAAPRAWPTV